MCAQLSGKYIEGDHEGGGGGGGGGRWRGVAKEGKTCVFKKKKTTNLPLCIRTGYRFELTREAVCG